MRGEQVASDDYWGPVGGRLAFAHRGGGKLWPENTRCAFEGALRLGCTHLETDVRMTRDGHVVIMHDSDISRTTSGAGCVSQLLWRDLQEVDAAYNFQSELGTFGERAKGHRVLAFSELLEIAPEAFLNVEIKEWGPPGHELPQAFWQIIEDHGLHSRILVAAEKHDIILRFRELSRGQVPTAASRRECLQFWGMSRLGLASRGRWPFQALQIPTHAGGLRVFRPQLLRAARELGIAVHLWTIDSEDCMERLLEAGADGLMSDRPDLLLKVLARVQGAGE